MSKVQDIYQILEFSRIFQNLGYNELIHIKFASQFFRATTGIQPGQTNFEESRSIMMSLTKSRVTGILCSVILILEGKEGEQIPSRLEFVKEISASISQIKKTTP